MATVADISSQGSAPPAFVPDPAFRFDSLHRPCGVSGSPLLIGQCVACQRCNDVPLASVVLVSSIVMRDVDWLISQGGQRSAFCDPSNHPGNLDLGPVI